MKVRAASCIALAAVLVGVSARAEDAAWKYEIEGGKIVAVNGAERRPVELPGAVVSLFVRGDRLYAALGADGAAVLDLADPGAPALVQRIPVAQGRVSGFVVVEEAVWMRIDSTSAVLVEGGLPPGAASGVAVVTPLVGGPPAAAGQPAGASQPAAPTAATAPPAIGDEPIKILEIQRDKGLVKLAVGAKHGVKVGDKFVVHRAVEMDQGSATAFTAQTVIADLEADAVGDVVTVANIWRGDRVRLTDVAHPAEEGHRPSKAYPRRLGRIGEVSLALRPLFNVGSEKGFGMLCDAMASWWGKYLFFDLRLQPLGFGWTDDGDIVSGSILADIGYDGRAFALGVGAGVGVVNGDLGAALISQDVYEAAEAGDGDEDLGWEDRTRAAFALSQVVRLGARDGFNIVLYNLLLYYDPPGSDSDESANTSGFYYGGTSGKINIPLAARTDLFFGGGGGLVGYWFSEVGVFFWARGDGDAGSIGVSASGGAAGIWGYLKDEDSADVGISSANRVDILGPMISLGLTGRFGPKNAQ